jgi:caa(3)-type oxidase subunit IV
VTVTDVRRITWVWIALSAITIGTWWLGHASNDPSSATRAAVTIAALAIAGVKVHLVIENFMEVRTAPRWLRVATLAWLVVLLGLIVLVYLW